MPEIENLDDLLKIPLQNQDGKIYNLLSARRKELFNYFWDKTKTPDDRNSVFDEANKISKYLNEKIIQWRAAKPKGTVASLPPTTKEQRKQNCDDLISYLDSVGAWDSLSPFEQGTIIARIWGTVKQ